MKRKVELVVHNETNKSLPKAKTRKYDKAYVVLGFTVTTVGDGERCLRLSECGLFTLSKNVGREQPEAK